MYLIFSLTVEEQLYFYGTLKGAESKVLKKEVDKMISDLNLEKKRDETADNLSGECYSEQENCMKV